MKPEYLIHPDWPVPANVHAIQTTRSGGYSALPFDKLNLGMHVGDHPQTVARNRQLLSDFLPSEPIWLNQVHGVEVCNAALASCLPDADACVSHHVQSVCTVMTADCLPVLFCDQAGTVVAAAHAGWRGLANGVLQETIKSMQVNPAHILAWFGPAISKSAFEVGEDVYSIFTGRNPGNSSAFTLKEDGKYMADIYLLARMVLDSCGVTQVYGGDMCTYQDQTRFFSFRRDGQTGRMATMIWRT